MNVDQYMNRFIRVGRINTQGGVDILSSSPRAVEALPYSPWLLESQGFACDWTSDKKGAKYVLPTSKIGLLHSISGPRASMERNAVLFAELLAIEEINQKGGVLGRRIRPVIGNANTTESIVSAVTAFVVDPLIDSVFGCYDTECRLTTQEM